MERDAEGRLLAVADSSFLINFLAVDRMDILSRLSQFRFHVVNHVVAEIRYEGQRARLQAAREGGGVTEIEITDPAEILLGGHFKSGHRWTGQNRPKERDARAGMFVARSVTRAQAPFSAIPR